MNKLLQVEMLVSTENSVADSVRSIDVTEVTNYPVGREDRIVATDGHV